MSKLLIRPKIHLNECIVSYLIRVSERNSFKHLGHLLQYAGLPWKNLRAPTHQMLTGEHDIRPYFAALGLNYIRPRTADIFKISQSPTFSTKIFVKYPKVCPQCLVENNYCHDLWSFIAYTACHRHKLMLVDTNPANNVRLSWYRASQDKFPTKELTPIDSQHKASADTLALSKTISDLISGKKQPKSAPPILSDLTFAEAFSIIHFIAHYQYRLFHKALFTPASLDNLTVSYHYTEAWKALKHWPKHFHLFLSQYIDQPMSKRGQSGINKHFRDIHEKLHRQRDNCGIKRLRTAFDQYIEINWPNAIQVNRLTRISLSTDKRPLINLKESQEILQCRPERIQKLIKQNQVHAHHFKGKSYFARDEIESIANLHKNNWTMEQACIEIELSRYHLKQLLDVDLIKALQKVDHLNRDWLINKKHWIRQINTFKNISTNVYITRGVSLSCFQKQGFSIAEVFLLIKTKNVEFNFSEISNKPFSFQQLKNYQLIK